MLYFEINGCNFWYLYGLINVVFFDLNCFYGVVGSEVNMDVGLVDLFVVLYDSFLVLLGVLFILGN